MENFWDYAFLQRALLMAVLGGGACGVMGVFVVLWGMSLMGMCVAHAAFAGALAALWLGLPPLAGSLCGSVGLAALVWPLAERPGLHPDTVLGVLFSLVMSLALLALGTLPGAQAAGLGLVWGSLLTVTVTDIALMAVAALLLLLFVTLLFKEIQAIIGQKRAAAAAGVPVRGLTQASLLLLGLVAGLALKAMGGLLLFALIVTPAASALQWTWSLRRMFVLSALIGAMSSALGLWLSFRLSLPPGATIALVSTLGLLASLPLSPKRRGMLRRSSPA